MVYMILGVISTILLILTWAYMLLKWSMPSKEEVEFKKVMNQNFDFYKKDKEPSWNTFKDRNERVYNPYKDELKKMEGKNETYFFGG